MVTFNLLVIFVAVFLVASCSGARDLSRLQNDGGGESECWTALANIRSCSNEIIGFFLNGQAQVDKPCCLAIVTIAQHCWPVLLGSLGYSPEEVSFLEGYCEKAAMSTQLQFHHRGTAVSELLMLAEQHHYKYHRASKHCQ